MNTPDNRLRVLFPCVYRLKKKAFSSLFFFDEPSLTWEPVRPDCFQTHEYPTMKLWPWATTGNCVSCRFSTVSCTWTFSTSFLVVFLLRLLFCAKQKSQRYGGVSSKTDDTCRITWLGFFWRRTKLKNSLGRFPSRFFALVFQFAVGFGDTRRKWLIHHRRHPAFKLPQWVGFDLSGEITQISWEIGNLSCFRHLLLFLPQVAVGEQKDLISWRETHDLSSVAMIPAELSSHSSTRIFGDTERMFVPPAHGIHE